MGQGDTGTRKKRQGDEEKRNREKREEKGERRQHDISGAVLGAQCWGRHWACCGETVWAGCKPLSTHSTADPQGKHRSRVARQCETTWDHAVNLLGVVFGREDVGGSGVEDAGAVVEVEDGAVELERVDAALPKADLGHVGDGDDRVWIVFGDVRRGDGTAREARSGEKGRGRRGWEER